MLEKAGFLKRSSSSTSKVSESPSSVKIESNGVSEVKKEVTNINVKKDVSSVTPKKTDQKAEKKSVNIVDVYTVPLEVKRVKGLPGYSPMKSEHDVKIEKDSGKIKSSEFKTISKDGVPGPKQSGTAQETSEIVKKNSGEREVLVKKKVVGKDGTIKTILVKKSVVDAKKDMKGTQVVSPEKQKSHSHDTKTAMSKNVVDLLKRGPLKKSHQPFGKKNLPAKPAAKPPEQKTPEKRTDSRKDSDSAKKKVDSSKERRKSGDKPAKRRTSSGSDKKAVEEEGPPPLLAPGKPVKHRKQHKPELDTSLDMSMMDLFKPDGPIVHEPEKKEDEKTEELTGKYLHCNMI